MIKEMRVSHIPLAALVMDFNIYPRHRVDPYHVRGMVETLRSGATLPPIRVDRASKRVVDGFHRVEAYRQLSGDTAKVPAALVSYKTEADLLADAVRLNAAHGRPLTTQDKVRCIILLEKQGTALARVGQLLHLTEERVTQLKAEKMATAAQEPIALKFTTAHMAGQDLTPEQASYNVKAGGMHQLFYVHQVTAMLEHDMVDWGNSRMEAELRKLYSLLGDMLTAKV